LLVIRETNQTTESLNELRNQIDEIDNQLLELLSKRMRVSREIGQYKKEHNMTVLQATRYDEILKDRISQAIQMDMSGEFMKTVLEAIHEESVRQQITIVNS
jgi:chorismate mutase